MVRLVPAPWVLLGWRPLSALVMMMMMMTEVDDGAGTDGRSNESLRLAAALHQRILHLPGRAGRRQIAQEPRPQRQYHAVLSQARAVQSSVPDPGGAVVLAPLRRSISAATVSDLRP